MFELFQLGLLCKSATTFQLYSCSYLEHMIGFEYDLTVTSVTPMKETMCGMGTNTGFGVRQTWILPLFTVHLGHGIKSSKT